MAVVVGAETKLTYEDLALFGDDGKIHEIIDGEHYVMTSPNLYHQRLSRRIHFQLYEQIELTGRGEVFNAPTDVELSRIAVYIVVSYTTP